MQAREEPKLFFLNNPCPLFIDEVQKESSILEEIKQKVDDSNEKGQFILSGSQKLELMKGGSESLAGRISICELCGLSLREIHQVDFNRHFVPTNDYIKERENKLIAYKNIWNIIHKGSYPELYDIERDWQDFYSSYVSTYLEKDINELISADSITFTKFLTAVAGNMFETFIVSEILKSYSNEGKDYRFNIFYYRGKDRRHTGENEIDLIIEENGILYPIEIKMSGNPKANMANTNQVLDKIQDKKRGMGIILCLIDKNI